MHHSNPHIPNQTPASFNTRPFNPDVPPTLPDPAPITSGSFGRTGGATALAARPRPARRVIAAWGVAALLLVAGTGGTVDQALSAHSGGTSLVASASLSRGLDHVHDGIVVPEASDGSMGSGWSRQAAPAQSTVDRGVVVDDAPGVLLVQSASMSSAGAGTGMVLSADGLALTNYHVVEGSTQVQVMVADTGQTYSATVLGRDATHDVAVLQLQGASGLDTVSVDASGVVLGEPVAAVGNGSGQGYLTAVTGGVTALDQSITAQGVAGAEQLTGLIQTDADVVGGYSGGPLVDGEGQVVGISTAASTGSSSQQVNGYAIPITAALTIADQIVNGTESDTVRVGAAGAIGVTVTANPTGDGAMSGLPRQRSGGSWQGSGSSAVAGVAGAQVIAVTGGGAADAAGIRAGDVITTVDGSQVTSADELGTVIRAHDPGDRVTVQWLDTAGATHSATVQLQDSPVN